MGREKKLQVRKVKEAKWLSLLDSPFQKEQLLIFVRELLHFNRKIGLFSKKQGEIFCWEMVLDSLLASKLLLCEGKTDEMADLGSGAGFPGIVFSVLDPKKKVQLFEVNERKASFLEYCCFAMGLKNTIVRNIPIQKEKTLFRFAVSKAFFSLNRRLELAKPLFAKGGLYYHLQSVNWKKEWEKVSPALKKSWKVESKSYALPPYLSSRVLLKTQRQ